MYRYIKGMVVEKGIDYLVVENSGIGYKLFASMNTINHSQINSEIKLYSIMIVKEDEISLCGFFDDEERKFFEYLTSVSGIGKKNAMNMLSSANYSDIASMIIHSDEKKLATLPGIGKKTAQRLIVELKDTLSKQYDVSNMNVSDSKSDLTSEMEDDVTLALKTLGFSTNEVMKMLRGMDISNMSVEEAISKALTRK